VAQGTTPDAKFGHHISSGLKKALATIGIVATTMATQDAYAAVTAAEAKADQVIECVVRDDSQPVSAKEGQDPAAAEAKAAGNVTEAASLDHRTTPPSELVSVIDPDTKETTLRPRSRTRSRLPRNTS
jgi:hypothetical protein